MHGFLTTITSVWIGPEPHGADPLNSGLVRDPLVAADAAAWLRRRHAARRAGSPGADRPFLLVVSFVNPHDIVFWPLWSVRSPLPRMPLPKPGPSPTDRDTLADRPAVQRAYREAYPSSYGPPQLIEQRYADHLERYRRCYLQLHAEVDKHLDRVRLAALEGDRDPVLVMTSDHGDFLGSHGGLHQKWAALYDESVRVPFVIAGPGVRVGAEVSTPTSHADLLPTILGLIGSEPESLREAMGGEDLGPLPGRDLGSALSSESLDPRPVYLCSRDNIFEGDDRRATVNRRFPKLAEIVRLNYAEPQGVGVSLEAVVVAGLEKGSLFKLVRTWDDPLMWSDPGVRHVSFDRDGERHERDTPLPDEWELYDLNADPCRVSQPGCGAGVSGHASALARRASERAGTLYGGVPAAAQEHQDPPGRTRPVRPRRGLGPGGPRARPGPAAQRPPARKPVTRRARAALGCRKQTP